MAKKKTKKAAKKKSKKKAAKKTAKRTPRKLGGRSLITKAIIKKIADLIRKGNYAVTAARASGISEPTFYVWKDRGREELERILQIENKTGELEKPLPGEALYLEFLEEIELADAESEKYAVGKVRSGLKDPDVAMKYLGLRFKNRWNKTHKHEHTGAGGDPIGLITREMTAEEASELYNQKLKKDRDG